jgi:hypothetical protein
LASGLFALSTIFVAAIIVYVIVTESSRLHIPQGRRSDFALALRRFP